MAQRRMITKSLMNDRHFLQLSRDAQMLLVGAIVHADDEGIVDVFPVMKLLSIGSIGTFKELVDSRFVVRLIKDDFIAYIQEWDEMNHVPENRFTASKYHSLKVRVLAELADDETENYLPEESTCEQKTD